ncbi:MAG TPA: endonuclease/exonuclease/phosphatase family protein [Opitutales bacterium]|nr:endonuclease/exonuclease/phosphatase family protein [Opitutales bacterium]
MFALLVTSALADLRIATYNLDNYLVMDRRLGDRWFPEYPKPESEKSVVRRIIREAAPDILALQEVGTVEFLEELRADLAEEGLDYEYFVHLDGPDPVRHLALLSKLPLLEAVRHTDLDFKYFDGRERVKRGMLEVSFKHEDGALFKLFVVHLKSKYTENENDPDSQLRRTREAEACRNRIVERTFDLGVNRFLVAGDFNDHPASAALRRFYSRGDLEIGSLLPAADSRGEVWTYFYQKQAQYSLVDGFVASGGIVPSIKDGRGHIVDSPGALDGSDHRMVYLDLVE